MKANTEDILNQFLALRLNKPEKAIELLINQYGDVLNGIVSKILIKEEDCEEAIQQGFIKVWKNLNDYSPDKSSIYTWLLTIFRNTSIDILRKESKRKIQSLDTGVYNDMKFSVSTSIPDYGLMNKIDSLDPKYRQLIDLLYFQGYTQQEVADEFEIPIGTIKTRISTAIKMLRTILSILIVLLLVHN